MARLDKNFTFGNIKYHYSKIGRKWIFETNNFTLIHPCRGGSGVAMAVAKQVLGGLKRTKGAGIDNLARTKIKELTNF